ncbi:MAG: CHAT domain-containing protein [Candidatus Krumholzibacteriia bacterium]
MHDCLEGINTVIDTGSSLLSFMAYDPQLPVSVTRVPNMEVFLRLSQRGRDSVREPRVLLVGAEGKAGQRRLDNMSDELRFLAELFPQATVLAGDAATERQLAAMNRSNSIRSYDVIHLACHAETAVAALESALILNDAGSHGPGADGRLEAAELAFEYDLAPDLVTLSGCSTARNQARVWREYHSLAQVLVAGGARRVLASRWDVDDRATALFMEHFYRELERLRAATIPDSAGSATIHARAFGDATRWLRDLEDADGNRPYAHPIYWSGFTLIGLP